MTQAETTDTLAGVFPSALFEVIWLPFSGCGQTPLAMGKPRFLLGALPGKLVPPLVFCGKTYPVLHWTMFLPPIVVEIECESPMF